MRFDNAIVVYSGKPEQISVYVTDRFDWGSLRQTQAIHVGAGPGHIGMTLAKSHAKLCICFPTHGA